ncbi:MAG: hypothetical protein LBQ89_04985 [Treponema sp.]|jgi:hypothetical protein|nr:hypothetical protein [Treponema sp.]
MEIKKMLKKIILIVVLLLLCQALYAQEAEYSVEYIDGKPVFYQRLAWESEEYALNYEALIEVFDNGYREYLRDTAKDDFILVSLPHGKYRYSVTPYDLLGNRGETSEWKEFEVLPAYQPAISSYTPELFYLDRNTARVITISGINFLEESEIYLQNASGSLYPEKVEIISNERANLYFDDWKLVTGSYDIYVKNPGGVFTRSGRFYIGYRKWMDFFLKPALTPVIPIYGTLKDQLGPNVYLAGLSFSFEAISSRRGSFNGGLELAASAVYLDPALSIQTGNDNYQTGYIEGELLLAAFDLNIALQRRFNRNRMALTFRFGLGAVTMNHLDNSEQNEIMIGLNLGVNFMVRLIDNFYIEAGVDFSNQMTSEPSGLIKPRLGVAWQL